ncbi:MAG: hypothetical protein QM831_11590 [Kofleriaceae bacterium]
MNGRLTSWAPGRATATGLDHVALGTLVETENALALVVALLRDSIELLPLSSRQPTIGSAVREVGPLVVPVGDDIFTRTIDCLGNPLAGANALARDNVEPLFTHDATVFASPVRRWTLGTLVYDLQLVLPFGASVLATGPREVLFHLLRHQVAKGCVVVLATPAAAPMSTKNVPWVHVAAASDATPAQQWLVPWTAMAVASALRRRGHEVVVAIDDLDAWHPHVRGAWATELAQLTSRAYATSTGSVSVIAMTRELSATKIAAFDEVLDFGIVSNGEIPFRSTKLVRPPIRGPWMRDLGYACVASAYLTRSDAPQQLLDVARRVRECLRAQTSATTDSLEQQLSLLAVLGRDDLGATEIPTFVDSYLMRLRRDFVVLLTTIRGRGEIFEEEIRALLRPR